LSSLSPCYWGSLFPPPPPPPLLLFVLRFFFPCVETNWSTYTITYRPYLYTTCTFALFPKVLQQGRRACAELRVSRGVGIEAKGCTPETQTPPPRGFDSTLRNVASRRDRRKQCVAQRQTLLPHHPHWPVDWAQCIPPNRREDTHELGRYVYGRGHCAGAPSMRVAEP
jgi:hypothetical protein